MIHAAQMEVNKYMQRTLMGILLESNHSEDREI